MTAAAFFAKLAIPIVQSPMVGASSLAMAQAVARAGGVGFLAGGAMTGSDIEAEAKAFRAVGPAPFGVNLFINNPVSPAASVVDAAIDRLRPWYEAIGAPPPAPPNTFAPDFEDQFAGLLHAAPPLASFTFACLPAEKVAALKAAGCLVVGTATTVEEAKAWAAVGADAISAQGSEAGGHRGHFLAETSASLVGTMALVGDIRRALDLPVLAAGGIMDGRGVAAALALGAAAAQMGTAFLLADEAVTNKPWRRAIETAPEDPTRLTRAFTGRHARGIENRFMREMRAVEDEVPAYPVQNRLTGELRAAAIRADEPDMTSLWAGQGVKQAGHGSAEEMVRRWWSEAKVAARQVAERTSR
ncbi:MAG TPA: nitronate monooxygenase [Caulobacteraceae bacterium]